MARSLRLAPELDSGSASTLLFHFDIDLNELLPDNPSRRRRIICRMRDASDLAALCRCDTGERVMAAKVAYWITTALIALAYGAGGYFDIKQPEEMMKDMASLGYPSYFFTMLGIWKLGAAVVLLAPALPRLQE